MFQPLERALCAGVLVALMALLPGCYRPQVVAGPAVPPVLVGLPGNRWPTTPGLQLHVFNTGMNRVSPLLVGSPAPWRPAPAFVITHPTQGWVVFDCGLAEEIAEHGEGALHPLTRRLFRTRSRPGKDLASQMRAAGLAPEEVGTVVFSHLHFDHVGAAPAFRNARFVVGTGGREAAISRLQGFDPARLSWIAEKDWRVIDFSAGRPYATFARTVDLFGDGSIVLVEGGGHLPGGLGALVHLPGGPVFLAGDLVVHRDWLASDDVQRLTHDPERAAEVRNRVRMLVKLAPQLVLLPGHDLGSLPIDRPDVFLHDPDLFQPAAWPID